MNWRVGDNQGLNRYERNILNMRSGTRIFRSLVAGASRVTRLSGIYDDKDMQCIWDTGANVAGPMIFFFVHWILKNSKERGVKRIYFMARDGQILLKVADIIKKRWGYDIECRYLYVSRQALYCPAIDGIGEFELSWMTARDWHKVISIEETCRRAGIKPTDFKESLYKYGFPENVWDKNLFPAELARLRECLQDPVVQEIITRKASAFFENTLSYFRQEGVLDEGKFAIVDLGWAGRLQFAISKIMSKARIRPAEGIPGFYLGLRSDRKIFKNDSTSCFLFDWPIKVKRYLAHNVFNQTVYEILTCADHGRTIGYTENNGRFNPFFDNRSNEYNIAWGCRIQQDSIVRFSDVFSKHCREDMIDEGVVQHVLEKILYEFMQKPSVIEATVYGKYAFSSEMMEDILWETAPIISHRKLWPIDIITQKRIIFWPSGSLVRSRMPFLRLLWVPFQVVFLLALRCFNFFKKMLD